MEFMDVGNMLLSNALLLAVLGLAFVLWAVVHLISTCYIKASPNEAVVVYGRGKKSSEEKTFSNIYTSGGRKAVGLDLNGLMKKIGLKEK